MQNRKTMRPITLKRIVELCTLALKRDTVDETGVTKELEVSLNRSKELLSEVTRMKLLVAQHETYKANKNTKLLIGAFEQEDWDFLHQFFLRNNVFYRDFIHILKDHLRDKTGVTIDQLVNEAKKRETSLNRTAIEVLQNWSERLGMLQRNLYAKRFYLVSKKQPDTTSFRKAVQQCYESLNTRRGLGLRLTYVEIPRLREDVCESLKMDRRAFDSFFKEIYYESMAKIELSGAPTITAAKRSPLTIRTMKKSSKEDILSPHLDLKKERKGIDLGGKTYYYAAIHEKLP